MALRQVDIKIQGDFVRDAPWWVTIGSPIAVAVANWGKNANGIKELLNGQGWIIERVDDESSWTGDYVYRVAANVGVSYSDGQIQDQIVRDLAGYFTVTNASIVSDPYQVPGQYIGGTGISGPANYIPTPGVNPPANNQGDFLNNLGLGAGISTPIALLAGALVLIVVLKK